MYHAVLIAFVAKYYASIALDKDFLGSTYECLCGVRLGLLDVKTSSPKKWCTCGVQVVASGY